MEQLLFLPCKEITRITWWTMIIPNPRLLKLHLVVECHYLQPEQPRVFHRRRRRCRLGEDVPASKTPKPTSRKKWSSKWATSFFHRSSFLAPNDSGSSLVVRRQRMSKANWFWAHNLKSIQGLPGRARVEASNERKNLATVEHFKENELAENNQNPKTKTSILEYSLNNEHCCS